MKIGFFGKLPSYGDFVQRNVSPALIDYWDNWILQAMDNAKSDLSQQWKEYFFTSPIWRFHIQSDVVCKDTVSGLMMPSVDSAGRCYPFFVFCRFKHDIDIFKLASLIESSHARCEEFLLQLLEMHKPNLDEVCVEMYKCYSSIDRVYLPEIANTHALTHHELFNQKGATANVSEINDRFLSFLASQKLSPLSLWCSAPSPSLSPQYRYYEGMPASHVFSSFIKPEVA